MDPPGEHGSAYAQSRFRAQSSGPALQKVDRHGTVSDATVTGRPEGPWPSPTVSGQRMAVSPPGFPLVWAASALAIGHSRGHWGWIFQGAAVV